MVEWTEEDTRDAARLSKVLAVNAEKWKRQAGGKLGPAPITESSATLEKAADSENGGVPGLLYRCPQAETEGERVDLRSETCFSFEYKGTTRPTPDEPLMTDRAKRHAPGDR